MKIQNTRWPQTLEVLGTKTETQRKTGRQRQREGDRETERGVGEEGERGRERRRRTPLTLGLKTRLFIAQIMLFWRAVE